MATSTETHLSVLERATGEVITEVPEAGAEDADAAIARTKHAFPAWNAVSPGDWARLPVRISSSP